MFKLSHAVLNKLKVNNRPLTILCYNKRPKSTIAAQIDSEEDAPKPKPPPKPRNSMVAAAFASLKPRSSDTEIRTPLTDDKIAKATTVDELLSISEGNGVSRRHALKVVSTLAAWSSSGKAALADFENDTRFTKLCRILTKTGKVSRNNVSRSEDLSTVLNVTADDEAARLVASLSLSQAVKVMTTLSAKKRRSISLLRALAYNITASSEPLNLKESADLLYSMCTLNFPDDNLVERICGDVGAELRRDVKKSAVVGSIVTSLGLMKYKNSEILDGLADWILKNHSICRPQELIGLFITLATVNYVPTNADEVFEVLVPQVTASEAKTPLVWLNTVWALVVLNRATPEHVSSVLEPEFVDKIEGSKETNTFAKIKLLNVDAAAELLFTNYSGARLSRTFDVNLGRSKEKIEMVETVVSTLKNLVRSDKCLNVGVNTGLGFLIDVKCLLDKKCTPLVLHKENETRSDVTRVAVMAHDYHNMCRGEVEPTGANAVAARLLESQNYKVLTIPYPEFKPTDKLPHRVQYLESKLKDIVK